METDVIGNALSVIVMRLSTQKTAYQPKWMLINHDSDRIILIEDDVLVRMKSRCKYVLTASPTIYEEELAKVRDRE